ncbi:manganese efflux pump MntP [Pseudomonas sp. KNUC1026]|uniref:manganese efflux pump MntP n=1 Tax=Pseudomonas sp. KNUC1026 TaxID=2893890 RepID=UPI001F1A580D|nr:manganese efflux pump MntP [Pseudomonas sp. KNUC1026]UFH50760.1 manganese efflux pump MntP [Pseudomonas sp. KNUC1026]
MSPISLVFLAFAMSTDAFAAAVGKGATLSRPRVSEALRTGLIFGVIEAATPLLGWLLGRAASQFVTEWDHWIAFVLLLGLGLHMVYAGIRPDKDEPEETGQKRHGFWLLAVTAFATSIDALAVGVGLAFVEVNILVAAAAIGLATMLMVTLGTLLGRVIGAVAGKRAEIAGGVVLMLVGATILYEHLSGAAA